MYRKVRVNNRPVCLSKLFSLYRGDLTPSSRYPHYVLTTYRTSRRLPAVYMAISPYRAIYRVIYGKSIKIYSRVGILKSISYINLQGVYFRALYSMANNAYSLVHPKFLKVVKTINTSETMEHIYASERLTENFIKYLEDEESIGVFPEGFNRTVLATYYGTELQRLIYDQLVEISSIKQSIQVSFKLYSSSYQVFIIQAIFNHSSSIKLYQASCFYGVFLQPVSSPLIQNENKLKKVSELVAKTDVCSYIQVY